MNLITKKNSLALLMSFLLIPCFSQTILIDFEEFNLSPDTFWNGSDGSEGFSNEFASFNNNFVDWGGGVSSWDGFAYSNKYNDSLQDFGNLYSTYAGNNSENIHALTYLNSDWITYNIIPNYVRFAYPSSMLSMDVSNSAFAALSMKNGDYVSKKFGGISGNDPDWFKLEIFGFLNGLSTDTIEFFLADYRFPNNSEDYIIKEWTSIDLTTIGIIDSLVFVLSSSDVGVYGINTPAVFCFDNLLFQTFSGISHEKFSNKCVYPNPANDFINIPGYTGNVEIYSLTGQLVMSSMINERLEIEDLKNGTYVLNYGNSRTIISKM